MIKRVNLVHLFQVIGLSNIIFSIAYIDKKKVFYLNYENRNLANLQSFECRLADYY